MYKNIYSSFICNSQKPKKTPISLCWGMIKQTTLCPYHGIMLSRKRETTSNTWNDMDEFQRYYGKWKTPNPKCYQVSDSTEFTFWKRQIFRDGKQNHSYHGMELEKGWLQKWHIAQFWGWMTQQFWYLGCDCEYIVMSSKPTELHIRKGEL